MGLTDVLFGRKKLKGPNEDSLFALTTACVTLQTELGLKPAGAGAVTYKSLSSGDFDRVETDVESLVKAAARSSGGEVERKTDSFGFEWVIVRDKDIEDQVNAWILESQPVRAITTTLEEARRLGAMALFGEKYGDVVRVVHIGPSREFCGGTHVRRTGDINYFKIAHEEGIAPAVGIR